MAAVMAPGPAMIGGTCDDRYPHRTDSDVVVIEPLFFLSRGGPGPGYNGFQHPETAPEKEDAAHDLKGVQRDGIEGEDSGPYQSKDNQDESGSAGSFFSDAPSLGCTESLRKSKKHRGDTQWIHQR